MESSGSSTNSLKKQPEIEIPVAVRILLGLGIALALFYVGGWYVGWGKSFWYTNGDFIGLYKQALYISGEGIGIRVNGLYYGMFLKSRFFDAPFISLVCFIMGFIFIGVAFDPESKTKD